MPRRSVRTAITAFSLLAILLAVWFVVTDLRAVWWPSRSLEIFARGAIADYLEMRCIAVDRVVLLGKHDGYDQLSKTPIGSYESGTVSYLAWRLEHGDSYYLVITSIFRDAEYTISMWDVKASRMIDEYVQSTVHGNVGATRRHELAAAARAASGLRRSANCSR
jgi:hypothetical protein